MRKPLAVVLLTACAAFAQTAETIPFRAILLPSNEVPAVPLNASGAATLWLHVVRDAQGRVTSASTDFNVTFTLPAENRVTGLHIHRGVAGENGPVLIDSGIRGAEPVAVGTTGRFDLQGQTLPTNAAGLETVNGILTNPSGYYANMHTADFPGGVIRGQLQRADMVVLMGLMSPRNENPPIEGLDASGVGTVVALMTRAENGAPTSGLVIFDANYRGFIEGTSFVGFHIHNGIASVNGPVTINTGIAAGANSVPAVPAGANLHYEVEVPMGTPAAVQTLQGLFSNPGDFYINLHTVVNPGGAIRSQLRRTDKLAFPVSMSPANEVPAITGLEASGPAVVTAHTIRNADGTVAAGAVIFDVNHRFPAAATFTGLHVHNGKAGENGPVTIDTGIRAGSTVTTESGFGNIYRIVTVSTDAGLATLNSLVSNPENHYVNLHTSTNPGGAVRSQLRAPNTAIPAVNAVISAVSDPSLRTVAPGGLMTIFGTDLIKTPSDLLAASNGVMLPPAYNGTRVTIGDKAAPLLVVTPTYVVAQVPMDAATGSQVVAVQNANGASAARMASVNVAATAPALFFDTNGGIFQKNSDFSLIGASNRARAGDIVVVYSTGLGVTTPALQSGQITPGPGTTGTFYNTAPATVTVGGRDARVLYSLASPGFAGLYQTAFEVPAGAAAGNAPVVLRVGGVASNSVNIALQ